VNICKFFIFPVMSFNVTIVQREQKSHTTRFWGRFSDVAMLLKTEVKAITLLSKSHIIHPFRLISLQTRKKELPFKEISGLRANFSATVQQLCYKEALISLCFHEMMRLIALRSPTCMQRVFCKCLCKKVHLMFITNFFSFF
jgi:hypothetical protein